MVSQPTAAEPPNEPPDEPPAPPELVAEPPPDEGGAQLTLGEHLSEIRQRLTISTLSIVLTTVVALVFAQTILDYLLQPGRDAYPEFRPIFTELLGFIGAYIKISLMLGIAGAMPILIYQAYAFIHPGLTRAERRWLLPIVAVATIAFACGGAFAYYIGWPPALDFLLNFGDEIAEPQVRINNYIDMLIRFVFWTGIVFEIPLFLMGLGALGLVTHRKLLGMWRWAIIGAFLLAALITPSIDPVTQTFVAVPALGLFGLGVLLVRLVERHAIIPVVEADPEPEED